MTQAKEALLANPAQAFGYMRLEPDASAGESGNLRQQLIQFAGDHGYQLVEIFVEPPDPVGSAFAALIEALYNSEARAVIVPSLHHFAHLDSLQLAMKELLERETNARVMTVAGDQGLDDS